MKKLFALLAGALCFGVAIAAETVITPEQVKAGVGDPWVFPHELAPLTAEDAKAQLESIADAVKASKQIDVKRAYATAQTVVYGKEHADATYAQLLEQQTANFKALGIGEPKGDNRISFVLEWYAGAFNAERGKAAYEANKELQTFSMGCLCSALGLDFATEVEPRCAQSAFGQNCLVNHYAGSDPAKAAAYYWPLVANGKLEIAWGIANYQTVLVYELGKEDFDAAELKAKLTRGILVYKAKARTWKGKEGESNPFVEFVGMLQDTAKDL